MNKTGKTIMPEDLKHMSRTTLIYMYRCFNQWGWPAILGDPPVDNWESIPEYRRSWMPKDAPTRNDFIRPYMEVIKALGITHEDAYGLYS